MAFVRRHRMVLVPLFLIVAAGLGVAFLLRSGSEEPAELQDGEPVVTAQRWEELVEARDDHTREWRVVRELEWTDAEGGTTRTEEVVSRVREVGSNLCYRDGAGDWQPSVPQWERTGSGFKADRNNYQVHFGSFLGQGYTKVVAGKSFPMRACALILSDAARSVLVGQMDPYAAGYIDPADPSKLVFPNAFRGTVQADLEYVFGRAEFHQNIRLHAPVMLPDGFDANTARLCVYTEFWLDSALTNSGVSLRCADAEVNAAVDGDVTSPSEDAPIAFRLTEQLEGGGEKITELFEFGPSRVYGSAEDGQEETLADRHIWRDPSSRMTYLVEQVPHTWLADATYPVTLDYTTKYGTISTDQVWRASATYYISSSVNLGSNVTLTIEPGTVVKFASASAINVTSSGAAIIAKGEPYNYIVFTSKNDDNSGATISGSSGSPVAADYSSAINIGLSASADSEVEYCKVAYAINGLAMYRDIGAIRNCVIHTCSKGIYYPGKEMPDIINNLIYECSNGIYLFLMLDSPPTPCPDLTICNNTIDDISSYGIYLAPHLPVLDGDYAIRNNMISNAGTGVCRHASFGGTVTLSNNGYWANTTDRSGDIEDSDPVNIPTEGDGPYASSPLGDYYIDGDGDGGLLVFAGSETYEDAGLDDEVFTFEAPDEVDSLISTAVWAPKPSGASWSGLNVSIGYHHNRVDYVVNDQVCEIEGGETLVIAPGTVVAFYKDSSSQCLRFDDAAEEQPHLICNGKPDDFIILAASTEVSMRAESQNGAPWGFGIEGLRLNAPSGCSTPDAPVTYTRVIGLQRGVSIEKDSVNEVKHCIFERGKSILFVDLNNAGHDVAISNCLSRYNRKGAVIDGGDEDYITVTLRNCTFDGNEYAIWCHSAIGTGAVVDIKDCLFSNCSEYGICLSDAPTTFTHDYNAFYRCGGDANNKKIWKSYSTPPAEETVGQHSIALGVEDDPYDSAAEWSWYDLWYLVQDGDCVGGGSRSVDDADLTGFPTKLDQTPDSGTVDIGYHYPDATPTDRVLVKNDDGVVQGLATYWPLDGSAIDYSESEEGTRIDGAITGATSTDEAVRGTALSFDGTNDKIEFAAGSGSKLDITSKFSIEAWARPDTTGGYEGIALKTSSDGSDVRYGLRLSDYGTEYEAIAKLDTSPDPSTVLATSSSTLSTESWTHLVATFDGSVLRLYEDGTEVGWTVAATGLTTDSGDKFWIGSVASAYYFDGVLDEVKVYDRCLSEWEVSCLAGGVDYIICTNESAIDSDHPFGLPLLIPDEVESLYIETYDATYNNPNGETISNPVEFTSLQEGINTIIIYGRDFAGNLSDPTEVMIIWDTDAPDITDDDVEFTDISPDGGGNGFDSTTITAYFGEDVNYVVSIRSGSTVLWSYSGTGSWFEQDWDGGGQGEGDYTLDVYATDLAGNEATSWSKTIRIDNTDPTPLTLDNLANVSATSFDVLWANPSPMLDEYLRYEIYLSQVDEFDWDGEEAMLLEVIDCSEDPLPRRYTVDWLNPGTKYYVKMVVRDTAGNPGASLLWSTTTLPTDDLFSRTWTMKGSPSEEESFEHDSVPTRTDVTVDSDSTDAGLLRLATDGGYKSSGMAVFQFAYADDESLLWTMAWRRLNYNAAKPTGTDIAFAVDTAPDDGGSPGTWTNIPSPLVSDSLAASWPLDGIEGGGPYTTPDQSDNGKDAQLCGGMGEANVVLGRFDNALEFDGTDDRLEATDSGTDDPFDITGDITITAWVRFHDTDGTQTVVSKADTSYSTLLCLANESGAQYDTLRLVYQGAELLWTWTPSNDRWYHVAAVYDSADTSSEGKLYVDGVRVKAQDIESITSYVSDLPVIVGARQNGAASCTEHLDGALDDVSIHSRALTDYEIAMLARGTLDTTAFRDFDPSQWIKVTATFSGDGNTTPKLYDVSIVYSDMSLDIDRDGLTEREERDEETDVFDADTDDDGLRDGFEVAYGFNAKEWNSKIADTDNDGLTDEQEQQYGTDPTDDDQNGNGTDDGDDYNNGLNVNGTDVAINDFGPGSDDPVDPVWVGDPEIEVWGSTDSTLAWAKVGVSEVGADGMPANTIKVCPHIYNGSDLRLDKLPLNDGVTALELCVHNIFNDELDPGDPGYTEKPEATAGPRYVAYDSNISVAWTVGATSQEGYTEIDGKHRLFTDTTSRTVDLFGQASVTWDEYEQITITDARLFVNGTEMNAEATFDNGEEPCTASFGSNPAPTANLHNGSNTILMEVDLAVDANGDEEVDFARTYQSPPQIAYYHQTLLAVAATDFDDNVLWTCQYSNTSWHDKAQFTDWANEACDYRYDDDDGTWHYGTAGEEAKAYELSSVGLYLNGELQKEVGTSVCLWSFQMTPVRPEIFAPQAILEMDDYPCSERYPHEDYYPPWPQRCFGQTSPDISSYSVMGNVLWSVNSSVPPWGPWYTTCDSLAPFQPTSLTSSAPYFETTWDVPGTQDAAGTHYGFGGYDFTWFYVLVEDYWQSGSNTSLIANYIYVDGNVAEATITTDASSPDSPTGKYDWTEYDYGDSAAPRPFIQVRSGSSAGEDDFTDDASGNVVVSVDDSDPDPSKQWNLPPDAVGDTIAIPLGVEYHWPDADKSVATGHKTVYAQKGIVVRVQVPEEIWAGESRPIYATLNGKYNDGSSKCGDVPWTYPIEWQFAEPVWEEEGSGEDVTYTPRPPETPDEYVPSQIMTGGHRLKTNTSPLYLGDMTSDSWGLVYVRAVISGVDVADGEVTQCAGGETITSAWVEVFCIEELTVRSSETGEEIGGVSLYLPDDGTDRGEPHFKYHDPLYALGMSLPDGLTEEVDTMVTWWHNNTIYEWESVELTETGAETNVFSYNEGGLDITVTLDEGAEVTSEYDAFGATVYRSDQVNPARRTFFEETDETTCEFESSIFGAQIVLVDGLASDEADIIQVMLFASTSSEAYDFIATEDGNNTKRFVSQDGLWFVDLPASYAPTASVDEAIVTVFGPATAEPQELLVRETGPETNVLVTMEYIDSEDTDYPEPSDTTFHYVEVKRWPGICGDERTVIGISGAAVSTVTATSGPSGDYVTPDIMIIPDGYGAPPLQGCDDFVAVLQDNNVARRQETDRRAATEDSPEDIEGAFYHYMTTGTIDPYSVDQIWQSFEKICVAQRSRYGRRMSISGAPNKHLRNYGVDFLANALPKQDIWFITVDDTLGRVADVLAVRLGHNVLYDHYLTLTEFGTFWYERIQLGLETPVIHIMCHYFLQLVNPYKDSEYYEVPPEAIDGILDRASTARNDVSAMQIRMFFISSCGAGKDARRLRSWQDMTRAYGVFGPTHDPIKSPFEKYVMNQYWRFHDCHSNGRAKFIKAFVFYPTIMSNVSLINQELASCYRKENDSAYYRIRKFDRWERRYYRSEGIARTDALEITGVVPDPGDERGQMLDWHLR